MVEAFEVALNASNVVNLGFVVGGSSSQALAEFGSGGLETPPGCWVLFPRSEATLRPPCRSRTNEEKSPTTNFSAAGMAIRAFDVLHVPDSHNKSAGWLEGLNQALLEMCEAQGRARSVR